MASTVDAAGISGGTDTVAPIYLGAIVAVSIIVVDAVLGSVLDRWPIAAAFVPLAAGSAGILVGWWALHDTVGGPT